MELAIISKASVLSEEEIDSINIDSSLPEFNFPKEDQLNYLATFIAENGAELKFEFQCSNSAEASDHIECMAKYFKKDIHFLSISGDKWNIVPDKLIRVFIKRKSELESVELEYIDSSFFSVKKDRLQTQRACSLN